MTCMSRWLTFMVGLACIPVVVFGKWSEKTEYNCCLAPGTGNPFVEWSCGHEGAGWRWSGSSYDDPGVKPIRDYRMVTLLVVAFGVQLLSVPIAWDRWHIHQRPFDTLVWLSAAVASVLYHLSDALRENVFGMTPSNWMRLSNLTALMLVVAELLFVVECHVSGGVCANWKSKRPEKGQLQKQNQQIDENIVNKMKKNDQEEKGHEQMRGDMNNTNEKKNDNQPHAFGDNMFKLEFLRWSLFSVFLILQEAWLWDWWISIGLSLFLAFTSVALLVSFTRRCAQDGHSSLATQRLTGLRTKLARQGVFFAGLFLGGMYVTMLLKGRDGLHVKHTDTGQYGDSDLHRVWYGSWSLLSIACLHVVASHPNDPTRVPRLRSRTSSDKAVSAAKIERACFHRYRATWGILAWIILVGISVTLPARPFLDPGRFKRWCCILPTYRDVSGNLLDHPRYDPYINNGCGSNGWRWKSQAISLGIDFEDTTVQTFILTTVLTNASGLPAVAYFVSHHRPFVAVIGIGTIVFSSMYHLAESVQSTVFGLTPGNYHRLDNVFAILSFISIFIHSLEGVRDHKYLDGLRTAFLLGTLYLQELGPWRIECTLVPVLLCLIMTIVAVFRTPGYARSFMNGWGAISVVMMGVAGKCFVLGLDEDEDHMRAFHGCWHLFGGVGLYCIARTCEEATRRFQVMLKAKMD